MLNILPPRPENFDARPCNYKDNFWFSDIERIVLENDYSEIDLFSENEEGFLHINNRIATVLSEFWARQQKKMQIKLRNFLVFSSKTNMH